jgi:hypothetical protein
MPHRADAALERPELLRSSRQFHRQARAPRSSASRASVHAGLCPPLLIRARHRHAVSSAFLVAQPVDELPHPGQVTVSSSFSPTLPSHRPTTAPTKLCLLVSRPSAYATSALVVPHRSPPPRLLAFDHRPGTRSHCHCTPKCLRRATPSGEEPSPPLLVHRLPDAESAPPPCTHR